MMIGLVLYGLMGQTQVSQFDESFKLFPPVTEAPVVAQADADTFKVKALAKVYRGGSPGTVAVDNGVVQFTAGFGPLAKPVSFSIKKMGKVATDLPVPVLTINGQSIQLGGDENGLRAVNAKGLLFRKPFDVKGVVGPSIVWPPRGMGVRFMWNHRELPDLFVELTYQMVDREPILNQTIVIRNGSSSPVAINSISQGDGLWPPRAFQGDDLGWVIRPGRTLELPEAWLSLDPSGKWVSATRKLSQTEISPWEKVRATPLKQWPPVEAELKSLAKSTDVVLMPKSAGVSWSTAGQQDYDLFAKFAAMAKKYGLSIGAEVDLSGIPANPEDRVAGVSSPVCWLSFSGSHWRSNAMLTWKKMGLGVVQLVGELPGSCSKSGHGEHQTPKQGEIENALSMLNFMRNGLNLGVIVRHKDARAYGPETTY
ncbi:MAG: hypothetical protein ACKVQS_00565 [Fimbriimonadaceae bacterium]